MGWRSGGTKYRKLPKTMNVFSFMVTVRVWG